MANISRRSFLTASAAASAAALAPRFARAEAAPAVITPKSPGKLRLLGFTDVHYFWHPQHDARTSREMRQAVERWQPDAVVVCGDLWMNNPEGQGLAYCEYSIGELEKLGVPWAFARGNHDQVDQDKDTVARQMLTAAPHSLYRGAETLDNYRIEVRSSDADKPFWGLYLFNNAYPELHGFHQEQLDWFAAEAAKVRGLYGDLPAFAFFHIPVIEYQYLADSGQARGVQQEKTSLKEGSPGAFAALKKENQVRAMFCGHNHLNNFYGEYEGVHLEYLRATGKGGYGSYRLPKGATLIELDATGDQPKFETFTVMPDGRKFAYKRKVGKTLIEG